MQTLAHVLVSLSLVLTVSAATFTVVNTNDSGAGSFRQAILDANGAAPTNTVAFNIPGNGLRVIKLLSALPPVTRPATIDGFTQPGTSENTLPNGNNANWLIELDGTMAGANRRGLELIGGNTRVRGLRISNFSRYGIDVGSDNCVVAGCFVYSNQLAGVRLDEADYNLIGGTATGDRNVISGNLGAGIVFSDDARFNQLVGNLIGTDFTGTGSFGNQGWGIHVLDHAVGNRTGGPIPGEGNVIAFNSAGGVRVEFFLAWNNPIRGNRIFSNGGLGIDLDFLPGISTNDLGDTDIGANQLQNFPLITNAVIDSVTTAIQGRLNSHSNTQYALDFYANAVCDASTYGEGEFFLGNAFVTTDSQGNANFEVIIPAMIRGQYFTATATDPEGNTSEFSPCWPQPLRLLFSEISGQRADLLLGNVDGSPISAERLPFLRILATTNLSPPVIWVQLPNSLELTNGFARVQGLEIAHGFRFFRAVESQ